MEYDELVCKAEDAMKYSYSPYSNVRVGAALLSKSGRVYIGCNVENASYGAAVCAERTALVKAVSRGERDFEAIAVASNIENITPCGICRQSLAEFSPDMDVVLKGEGGLVIRKLRDYLPDAFSLKESKG